MSVSRRNLLQSTAAPWISLAQKKTGKTNVLMFAIDDLNTRIACYGDPLVNKVADVQKELQDLLRNGQKTNVP